MQCYNPIRINTKNEFIFSDNKLKAIPLNRFISIPCGRCLGCLSAKSREWSMRVSHESMYYDYGRNAMFITLTYNKENLPNNYSLCIRDLQLFYKRLRKDTSKIGIKIKHFSCGEYGTKYRRPHYHAIIFGMSYSNPYMHILIKKNWNKGFSYIGNVSDKSIAYCCKYMLKDSHTFCSKKVYFERYKREQPFRVMSKGIGKRYCLDFAENIVENLNINYNDLKLSIPRTYISWIWKNFGVDIQIKLRDKIKEIKIERLIKLAIQHKCYIEPDLVDEAYRYDIESYPTLYKLFDNQCRGSRYKYESRHNDYLDKRYFSRRILDEAVG